MCADCGVFSYSNEMSLTFLARVYSFALLLNISSGIPHLRKSFFFLIFPNTYVPVSELIYTISLYHEK